MCAVSASGPAVDAGKDDATTATPAWHPISSRRLHAAVEASTTAAANAPAGRCRDDGQDQ